MAFNNIVCAPVGERARMILESNEKDIVNLMDPDTISRLLMDKGIIDNIDRKEILLPLETIERNRILLARLLTRGRNAFQTYMRALIDSATEDHLMLARILRNDDPIPSALPVEGRLQESRHKRINEKIEEHEQRLKHLEENLNEPKSEEDFEILRTELTRKKTELDELREELKTRDGELEEAREENKVLQRRVLSLERKIQGMEQHLREQKAKVEQLTKQQQVDRRSMRLLEDKNTRLENKMEQLEKKIEKRFLEQEKRHQKELDEVKQSVADSARPSDGNISSRNNNVAMANKSNTAAGNLQKVNIIPKNRFQSESTSQIKCKTTTRNVPAWKKSTIDPEQLPTLKSAGKKKK